MKDKEKYFNLIEKNIIKNIYEESINEDKSYFDYFMKVAKNFKDVEPFVNYIERCVMANDAEALVYLIVANKIVKHDNKLYNVINNEVKDELSNKLALDVVRILINNKFVHYATKLMTEEIYYKVHFLDDLSFLDEKGMLLYLFGNNDLPVYFINQFNDFELDSDKEIIVDRLIHTYGAILDEVPKYYHSYLNDNKLLLEYPSDVTKRDKQVEFNFIDLTKLEFDNDKLKKLINIEKRIKDLVRKEKEYAK